MESFEAISSVNVKEKWIKSHGYYFQDAEERLDPLSTRAALPPKVESLVSTQFTCWLMLPMNPLFWSSPTIVPLVSAR